MVILSEDKRQTTEDVRKLPIKTAGGLLLPLEEFADIRQQSGRYNILHQDGQRLQSITSSVVGRDIVGFMDELEKTVFKKVKFSAELYPEFTGAAIEQAKAKEELLNIILVSHGGGYDVALYRYWFFS